MRNFVSWRFRFQNWRKTMFCWFLFLRQIHHSFKVEWIIRQSQTILNNWGGGLVFFKEWPRRSKELGTIGIRSSEIPTSHSYGNICEDLFSLSLFFHVWVVLLTSSCLNRFLFCIALMAIVLNGTLGAYIYIPVKLLFLPEILYFIALGVVLRGFR